MFWLFLLLFLYGLRFSFATPPHITLVAKPRVGQHEVKVNQVTDWIERKLISEFKVCEYLPATGLLASYFGLIRKSISPLVRFPRELGLCDSLNAIAMPHNFLNIGRL